MDQYPILNFITQDPHYSDYRPAVGPDGTVVIFERTVFQSGAPAGDTTLYVVDDLGDPDPVVFIPAGGPDQQTRADWCWAANTVAFNGDAQSVWIADGDGTSPWQIGGTNGLNYPAWSPDGATLTVENGSTSAKPRPSNSRIDTSGGIVWANMNGSDADGNALFGGMPAVNPVNDLLVAFAGQPDIANWPKGSHPAPSGYNQDANYIFLNSGNAPVFTSAPLEQGAPIDCYNEQYQGRAPAWSPDGRYVVFESARSGEGYAIYLFDTKNPGKASKQLTDPGYQAQHAKFFPDGTKLALVALQSPGATGTPNGIAWIDISGYLE
ncbi:MULTISPECIES: hypothetical protein [unclassified Microbulbifer]|uniref:hypothetical protein n=1 Tax=unclassified Microbulbifer TaxID=2619833 RepID=UPI0027E41C56|nr:MULTISPECIES: hypothetical protein [unclassified Microbulbifer]